MHRPVDVVIVPIDAAVESYDIGTVIPPDSVEDAEVALRELWSDWRIEVPEPEHDSQFIQWLVERHGWTKPKLPLLTVHLYE